MITSTIEAIYNERCVEISDINEHLPILYKLALECESIAEFGVRSVVSSFAFAHARPKELICIDIEQHPNVDAFLNLCIEENVNAKFFISDSRKFEMKPVDMIFIDTLHTYGQLKAELQHLGNMAQKYLVFHDTITYGHTDEQYVYSNITNTVDNHSNKTGLVPAIKEFLDTNSHWKEMCTYNNNNGLTILQRINK